MPNADRISLSSLVDRNSSENVLGEVKAVYALMYGDSEFGIIEQVFDDVRRLFRGEYPGYRGCTTEYHDFDHTLDVFLAAARLIHGVQAGGRPIGKEAAGLGLTAALMHDTGYIQQLDDNDGTGAKYTRVHVERSVEFMKRYFKEKNLPDFSVRQVQDCGCLIMSTAIDKGFDDIPFSSPEMALVGRIEFAADLLGQMADRLYLEKLLFLYHEFAEGQVMGYEGELDLLRKTTGFYEAISGRLRREMADLENHMRTHFRIRWGVDRDLYQSEIESNLRYLKHVLEKHSVEYRSKLRRGGIVDRLNAQGL